VTWRPTARTRVVAVIGDPVRHSLSPVIHNAAYRALELDWVYVALPVPAGGGSTAVAAVRALGLAGINVTMPLKHEAAAAVDRLSAAAEALDAVNTVVPVAGELVGENTDGQGFLDALRLDALAQAGAREVVVVNRTATRAEAAVRLAGGIGRLGTEEDAPAADLVVNATPIGMAGQGRLAEGAVPLDPSRLHAGQVVVDLVYEPPVTALLKGARARGAVGVNGLGMLIHQAAHAFRLFTGEDPPLEVMSAAVTAELTTRSVVEAERD
jgi:shikimate dehydrogenase